MIILQRRQKPLSFQMYVRSTVAQADLQFSQQQDAVPEGPGSRGCLLEACVKGATEQSSSTKGRRALRL